MADASEKTAGGATRVLFGTLGFIFIMVGVEGVTGVAHLPFGGWLILLVAGGICTYAAFFWEKARGVLSENAQTAIGKFAQHPVTTFGVLALAVLTLILSPFIEQHRWPFSYPADPKIEQENNQLKSDLNTTRGQLGAERDFADRWRITHALRTQRGCRYELHVGSRGASTASFWDELFQAGRWNGTRVTAGTDDMIPTGVFFRVGSPRSAAAACAVFATSQMTPYYTNPSLKVLVDQQTPYLLGCGDDCIQIDINY
jgi:hypothetical protein